MAEETQDEKIFSPPNPNLDHKKLYIPLAQNSKRIRLLELLPGKGEEPISCRLLQDVELPTHNESCSIPFEALSYCAGDANDYVQIIVDGLEFNSFATLAGALKVFRFEDRPRIVWTDQICINQIDFSERGQQVAMMVDIYSTAARVLIWAGESCTKSKSHLMFELIGTFLQAHGRALEKAQSEFVVEGASQDVAVKRWLAAFFDGLDTSLSSSSSSSSSNQDLRNSTINLLYDPDNLPTWIALENFLSRPYWTRMWIVQEIALSLDALIYCGIDSCRLLDFVSVIAFLMWTSLEIYQDPDNKSLPDFPIILWDSILAWMRHTNSIFNIWSYLQTQPLDILENLRLTEDFSSSDPRDRVYALLGLLSEKHRIELDILVDYSKANSPLHTLVHVANAWIKSGGGLGILDNIRGNEVELGLPSWVPNFFGERSTSVKSLHLRAVREGWEAGGPGQVQAKLHGDGRILSLEGMIVSEIGEGHTLGAVDNSKTDTEHSSFIRSWQNLVRGIYPAPASEIWHEFWRTLSLDSVVGIRDEEDPSLWGSQYTGASMEEGRYKNTMGRRFGILPNGLMGLFPKHTQPDDLVVIFSGGCIPYVIRKRSDAPTFHLIGECYVSRIMYGAAMVDHLKHGRPFVDICLS